MDSTLDHDDRERRYEEALDRLGTRAPRCQSCTEANALALMRVGDSMLCFECRARLEGKSPFDDHHPMGRHNDPLTVRLPTNDHRIVSDMQIDWPAQTLRNPEQSPLRKASAALRGWIDVLRLIMYRAIGWIPDFLDGLDEWLTQEQGEQWWNGVDWQGAGP